MAQSPKITPAAARAAIASHGSLVRAAAATGVSKSAIHRAAQKATAADPAQPPLALPPEMASLLQAMAAALVSTPAVKAALQGASAVSAVASPRPEQEPVPVSVPTPAPLRPRIRVPARTAPARVSAEVPPPEEADPLGDNTPYRGEIFGVHATRRPRIGAPVSRQHIRVLAIGDSHFHPGLPQTLRCMSLIGHHAAATRPEYVVHIGDGSDWHSVCRHTKNDTWKARQKPSIRQDLLSFAENWAALNAPMDAAGVSTSRHYCMGNHDAWLESFEDSTPEIRGMATGERNRVLEQAGWTWSDYGEFHFLGGVGFTHIPLNLMGKPMGGQTPENSVAIQATHDVVFGHTHRYNSCRRVKVGYANQVSVLNTGGSMPEFYVGDYAQNTQGSAMTSGVLDIDIFDGRIQGHRLVTMRELEKRYGHFVA